MVCVITLMTGTLQLCRAQLDFKRLLQGYSRFLPAWWRRKRRAEVAEPAGSGFRAQKRGTDLGAIAMGKNDAKAVAEQADELAGRAPGIGQLLGHGAFFTRSDQ